MGCGFSVAADVAVATKRWQRKARAREPPRETRAQRATWLAALAWRLIQLGACTRRRVRCAQAWPMLHDALGTRASASAAGLGRTELGAGGD